MKTIILTILFLSSLAMGHINVTVAEANDLLDSNDAIILIDVRELCSEYCSQTGHIPGALNYPYYTGDINNYLTDFEFTDHLMIICHSGNRSNTVANWLDSQGFENVYDILGGITAWTWEKEYCADTDGDGEADFCDYDCADMDGANPVDWYDWAYLAENINSPDPDMTADLNNDGQVDIFDARKFFVYWLIDCYVN